LLLNVTGFVADLKLLNLLLSINSTKLPAWLGPLTQPRPSSVTTTNRPHVTATTNIMGNSLPDVHSLISKSVY